MASRDDGDRANVEERRRGGTTTSCPHAIAANFAESAWSHEPTTLFRAISEVATARLGAVHGAMSGGVAVPAFAGKLGAGSLAPVVNHRLNGVFPRRGFTRGTFEEFLQPDQEFSHHLISSRLRLAGKLLGDCEHNCFLGDERIVSIGFMGINGFVHHIPIHRLGDQEDAERVGLMKAVGPNTFVVEERLKIQEAR